MRNMRNIRNMVFEVRPLTPCCSDSLSEGECTGCLAAFGCLPVVASYDLATRLPGYPDAGLPSGWIGVI